MTPKIAIPQAQIEEFCRRNHIRRLALFGSVLRDDFGPESDIDVLVEFEDGKTPGFAFFGMQDELSELLGRRVDLNTEKSLSPYFKKRVLRSLMVLYERA
jgi:uncharacterized protein